MTPPATFFVTGASGFVGRHLCRRLRVGGHQVRGLMRSRDPALEAIGVEVVQGDIATPGDWQGAITGAHYVIHCAALAAYGRGREYKTANVDGTGNVLAAANAAGSGLRRFVFVSTIGAIDRRAGDSCKAPLDESAPAFPSSDYGRSKLRGEQLVRASGLPFSIVRPAMVVGSDMRVDSHFAVFVRAALRRAAIARFAWPGQLSVVHVDDLAAALELCATHPAADGRIFFCAGAPLSLRRCFELANPSVRRIPMRWAAGLARLCPWLVPFPLKVFLWPALTASDAALTGLGWRALHSAAETLQEVIVRESARVNPEIDPGGQTVITGAASGLGRSIVDRLASQRRQLLLVDRDSAGLARVQAAYPHCRVCVVDLADEIAVAAFVRSSDWRAHPVRELFACAGLGLRGPVLASCPTQHARLFKVNVLARLTLAHAAIRGMISDQLGRIVFISSSSAFQPLPYMASYAASNSALLQLGEAWAAELTGSGVHLLTVCPGGMQTNFQAAAGVKQLQNERLTPPEAVAERIVRELAQCRYTSIVSTRAHGMALAARLLPRAVSVALWKRLMIRLR